MNRGTATGLDPVLYQVIQASFAGIVQEMQNSLFRTGFSTIIRESQDASCAICDREGRVIAQHVVLPLHIGAFPACVAAVLRRYPAEGLAPGDAFLINHPYEGGSPHAPDMAVLTPIFHEGEWIGFCGSIAHKSDLGGPVPGSCSGQAREVFNEGLHLPAVRYCRGGEPSPEIEAILAANSRTPELVLGDIRGQLGADRLGERRVSELLAKYGKERVVGLFAEMFRLTEARVRRAIASWPDGEREAERFVDDDGVDLERPVRIHVRAEKRGDTLRFDFTGSQDQTRGPANIRPPLVRAACAYALIALIDPELPINSGLLDAFDVRLREGSVLHPRHPAPVNTYNPTVHALIDALFDALSGIAVGRRRADASGSRSIILGGRSTKTGRNYVQYEIVGGGSGGRTGLDGVSGTSVNHSNARIAPVEIIESEFPTRILRFELIPDSGGPGEHRGGLGILRVYENLEEARFSLRSSKHTIPPLGLDGGEPGRTGALIVNPGTPEERRLPTRYADYPLKAGDIFRFETPGGGGLGNPLARDPARVLDDVRNGYVTRDAARERYGVILSGSEPEEFEVDPEGTERLREEMRRRRRTT